MSSATGTGTCEWNLNRRIMNPAMMSNSLPNSLYNAITPYPESQYSEYQELYTMNDYHSPGLQETDFLNNDNSQPLDAALLDAFSGSDYTPLANLTEVDMSVISQTDLLSLAPQILHDGGSDGAEDSVSDYSDPESSYSDSYSPTINIMNDTVYNDFQTESDLQFCQPMKDIFSNHDMASQDNPSQKKKPGRKKGQTSKVLHLWEFIRDLLKDPKCNGNIIQWENKQEGVFRVVKSNEVASLWGKKKKNKKEMTYEKMSRSMRYSRKEGYFIDLPKNSGYPKKLCFRFGPKSTGWQ